MGLLDNFEKGLERAVNGAFAKTFKSGIQPVEITSALRRELDTKAAVVCATASSRPTRFTVRLAPADYERMTRPRPDAHRRARPSSCSSTPRAQGYSVRRRRLDHPRRATPASATGTSSRLEQREGHVAWTPVARHRRQAASDRQVPHGHRPRQRRRHHRSTTPAPAASTSRSSGTASAPRCATWLHQRLAAQRRARSTKAAARPRLGHHDRPHRHRLPRRRPGRPPNADDAGAMPPSATTCAIGGRRDE